MRERIIETSIELFRTCGVRETSMDCIAKELRVSKRTIYQYFQNKEDLIRACVEYQIERLLIFYSTDGNLLDELMRCYGAVKRFVDNANHNRLFGIWKFHKDIFSFIRQQVEAYASMCAAKVGECQREGYIRGDVSPEFVDSLVRDYLLRLFFCKGCFQLDLTRHGIELLEVLMRGISTPEGNRYITSKLKVS